MMLKVIDEKVIFPFWNVQSTNKAKRGKEKMKNRQY